MYNHNKYMASGTKICLIVAAASVVSFAIGYLIPHGDVAEPVVAQKKGIPSYSFEKADIKKAVELYRTLPPKVQAALIGSRMGLFFLPNGNDAYDESENYSWEEKIQYYKVMGGALYVGFEGHAHEFYNTIRLRDSIANAKENWVEIMRLIGSTSDEALFAGLADDVKKLARQAILYHLNTLSQECRDAWLAEWGNMLYLPGRKSIFTGEVRRVRVPGTHREWVRRLVDKDTLYVDSKGIKHSFNEIYNRVERNSRDRAAWKYASYCAVIMQPEGLLTLYPEAINAMRKSYAKATRQPSAQ